MIFFKYTVVPFLSTVFFISERDCLQVMLRRHLGSLAKFDALSLDCGDASREFAISRPFYDSRGGNHDITGAWMKVG